MIKTIVVKQNILSHNDELANQIRQQLDAHSILALNFMASPGGGKTSVINTLIHLLKRKKRIAVIEGDVVTIDVNILKKHKIPVILANTHGACHLDSLMVLKALNKLTLSDLDVLFIENVGNLVCPANFPLGNHSNIVIASVPEGDDKPKKYPNMFRHADIVLLNKIDVLPSETFSMHRFQSALLKINPRATLIPISCKTREGFDSVVQLLFK